MNPTDILLSIAIVGIYTQIYIYLKTNNKEKTIPLSRLHKYTNTLKKPKIKFNKKELLSKDFIIINKVTKMGISLK